MTIARSMQTPLIRLAAQIAAAVSGMLRLCLETVGTAGPMAKIRFTMIVIDVVNSAW